MTTLLRTLSRRHFLATSAAATATCLVSRNLFAQPATDFLAKARAANAKDKITTTPLRRNVTALLGAGGNIAVLTAKEGKLIVDSGYASCQPQLTVALAAIDAQPMHVLINTHWH
ncbi:MAG: twin-arginine translocation signal domain-containing protein, partial [Edaphobacter sp.]